MVRIEMMAVSTSVYICSPLIFDKGAKNMHWKNDNIYCRKCWEDHICTLQKNEAKPLSLSIVQKLTYNALNI